MKFQLIEFKRCCCCIPLRYGMLAAGYIQVLLSLFEMLCGGIVIYRVIITLCMTGMNTTMRPVLVQLLALAVASTMMTFVNTVMTVIFLVGCHRKDKKLLHVFNTYAIGCFVLDVILKIWATYVVCDLFASISLSKMASTIRLYVAGLIGIIFVNIYLILMIRSEIKKLEDNGHSFTFENIAAEAECAMVTVDFEGACMKLDVSENGVAEETAEAEMAVGGNVAPPVALNGTHQCI